jgi:GTPase SAR1 family protein
MSKYQYELAKNYNHAKKILVDFLDNPKNEFYSYKIVLIGIGGNGKTYLINELDKKLKENNYRIFQDLDIFRSDIVKGFLEKPINTEGCTKNLYTLNELPECKIVNAFILDMNNIKFN